MNVLISGGCKNGKSMYAQQIASELAACGPLYYIATMIPHDEEDRARIRRHLKERDGWGFETLEQGKNIAALIDRADVDLKGSFLLDSVTAVLENEMFPVALNNGHIEFLGEDEDAPERVRRELVAFAAAVKEAGGSVVFVSDGIYGDKGGYSPSTEHYRHALADADRALAQVCDRVIEVTYGITEEWK
jgi:adenosylcobinamide kinase/adenosylcobinamide-phosphate guanylyltransferase